MWLPIGNVTAVVAAVTPDMQKYGKSLIIIWICAVCLSYAKLYNHPCFVFFLLNLPQTS